MQVGGPIPTSCGYRIIGSTAFPLAFQTKLLKFLKQCEVDMHFNFFSIIKQMRCEVILKELKIKLVLVKM